MKVIVSRNNRTFEAYVNIDNYGFVDVTFYEEVRPSWKIFRTKFFPFHSSWFRVNEYSDIMIGIETCLMGGFHKEGLEKNLKEKIKDFEKPIDKSSKV